MCLGGTTAIKRDPELPEPADLPPEQPVAPLDAPAKASSKQPSATARTTSSGTGLKIPVGV
jgi:hypothetical protein